MKDLKPYLIKFEKDRSMNTKDYSNKYVVKRNKYCFVIIIIYNKYIFFANNKIWKI